MRLAPRIAATAAALIAALPGAASADGAMGVAIGRTSDERGYNEDPHRTLGVWGRLGLGGRFSAQLELQKLEAPYDGSKIRSATAVLVLDLRTRGRLRPVIVAGAGLDRVTLFGTPTDGHHFEGGLGLEYRAAGGLFVGADVRHGGRSIENGQTVLAGGGDVAVLEGRPLDIAPLIVPAIAEGEYVSARLTVGVTF